MSIPFNARLTASESVLINTFDDGESVLLNLDTEHYFGLNDSGSRMWEVLTSEPSIEAAYAALLAEYEVEPESLREDLVAFVDDLVEHQLVEVKQDEADG
jgi:hypothetical protein